MKHTTEQHKVSCGFGAGIRALESMVDAFCEEMKKKLIRKFPEKLGWDNPEWRTDDIKKQLIAHVEKGDPIDVANFAAFWWNKL